MWVANAGTDSLTQVNVSCLAAADAVGANDSAHGYSCAVVRADRAGYHYMARPKTPYTRPRLLSSVAPP